MRVYSYIVVNDGGFAPNPFHGLCTLACCKPKIRASAAVGDMIVGLSSRSERIVYAMRVDRVLSFADYWSDPAYAAKRPQWRSARELDRCGDNIYRPGRDRTFSQLASYHSRDDGTEHPRRMAKDLRGEAVLVGERFVYFGASGPPRPAELAFLKTGRGHRCRFTDAEVAAVVGWFADKLDGRVHGRPKQWPDGDETWAAR